jgi:hypothetical protein
MEMRRQPKGVSYHQELKRMDEGKGMQSDPKIFDGSMENDIRFARSGLRSQKARQFIFFMFFPDPRRDQVTRRIPLAFTRPVDLYNKSDPDTLIHVDPDSGMDRTRRISTPA